jgi:hypothetical protein
MAKSIDDLQKVGTDQIDVVLKSFDVLSRSAQAIATEFADYSKQSFEEGSAVWDKLLAAKTVDKAFEVQSEYARSAYEGFVSRTTKLGALYAELAKESYRPFEAYIAKTAR